MRTYVLVHGGFGGGWAWREFANLLRSRGQEVYTPTLTGLGERVHLGTEETNLNTHIQDIVNVIEYEDLRDVVLAGYSYGGMVITGVADRIPDRIAHLVYIDADLPWDGESESEAVGATEWANWTPLFIEDGWRLHLRAPPDLSPEEQHRRKRYVGQPRRTFEEKLRLERATDEQPFTRTFIAASDSAAPKSIARVRDNPAWRFHEVPGGHSVYRDAPKELATILLALD